MMRNARSRLLRYHGVTFPLVSRFSDWRLALGVFLFRFRGENLSPSRRSAGIKCFSFQYTHMVLSE